MANLISYAKDAIMAVQMMDGAAGKVLPEQIASIVKNHAKIAVATAFIPIGGLDIAAATANVWTMYARINSKLELCFSENVMKSIGSAIVSNLTQNAGIIAIAAALKWTGASLIASIATMTGALYALTLTSGIIYLKALTLMARNDSDIDSAVKEALKDKNTINEHLNSKIKK